MKSKSRSLLTLSQLQVLIAISESGSFSDAALQLEMAQSGVSNAIANLEDQLGVVLFSRGRHGARLTPVGERVLHHAQEMMQLQDEIFKEANRAKSLRGGEIRITSFRSVTTHVLSSTLARFHQQYPEISIQISERQTNLDIKDDLRLGRADIGFIDYPLGGEFEAWELLKDEYVVLVPDSLKSDAMLLRWEELSTYPFVLSAEGDQHDEAVRAHCSAFEVTLHAAYHVGADSSIVSMVAQGLGAAIMPRLAAKPIPDNVAVYSLPVPLFRTIWVAVLAEVLLPPAVFAFLDLLKSAPYSSLP